MKVIDAIRTTVVDIAAKHAADVDERARFPTEELAAAAYERSGEFACVNGV